MSFVVTKLDVSRRQTSKGWRSRFSPGSDRASVAARPLQAPSTLRRARVSRLSSARSISIRARSSVPSSTPGTPIGAPSTTATGTERLRDLRPIPAPRRPIPSRLEVKRQDRLTGRSGKPHGTRLRHSRGTARTVNGEGDAVTCRKLAAQLHERPGAATGRRAPRRRIAEAFEDARNPLPVEVLAREGDDAAVAEVVEAGQDAAVPAGEDGLPPGIDDGVVMFGALDLPGERAAQAANEGSGHDTDGTGLEKLKACEGGLRHSRWRAVPVRLSGRFAALCPLLSLRLRPRLRSASAKLAVALAEAAHPQTREPSAFALGSGRRRCRLGRSGHDSRTSRHDLHALIVRAAPPFRRDPVDDSGTDP